MRMETERENEELVRSPSSTAGSDPVSSAAELITSFSNPNYNIEEDILNCNVTTPLLEYTNEEILNRLEGVVGLRTSTSTITSGGSSSQVGGEDGSSSSRRPGQSSTGLLAYYRELTEAVRTNQEEKAKTERQEAQETTPSKPAACLSTPDSLDSGIQVEAAAGSKPDSGYDLSHVVRRREKKAPPSPRPTSELPAGWEKYEDEEGPYYWHVKTGTIQRAPPSNTEKPMRPVSFCSSDLSSPSSSTPDLSNFASLAKLEEAIHYASIASESTSNLSPIPSESSFASSDAVLADSSDPLSSVAAAAAAPSRKFRFSVRSLGWAVMADEELTPERSSQSVNRCIVRMAAGQRDFSDSVGKWGDGQDLLLELSATNLVLMNPISESVLHKQPIIGIKVWGVGRENNRDFAYVSRDRGSRKYHCHVFRCDQPARHLANTLCALCKHLVLERKRKLALKQQQQQQPTVVASVAPAASHHHRRPVSLPGVNSQSLSSVVDSIREERASTHTGERGLSFPTPMEEPKKILKCYYIGSTFVKRPNGVEVLNEAIEKIRSSHPRCDWIPVTVTVAPSTVKIMHDQTSEIVTECRVRFLAFMGISISSVQLCGFIMHTAQNTFACHVLYSEPTCGPLCKTIEAACTLRFQKCLDAHVRDHSDSNVTRTTASSATTPSKRSSIKEGLQSMWAAMSLRKTKP